MIELDRHGFASVVVLHGNHGGIGSRCEIAFEAHAIIEFQRQAGNEDGVLLTSKLQERTFTQATAATERRYQHGNPNRVYIGEEACQLLRAS